MPLTDKNQLLIAYKRLLGKVHTNPSYGISNETIGAYIQAASSQIFGEDHSLNNQQVTFTVHSLASGVYKADIETGQHEDIFPIAHVFELKLKENLTSLDFIAGTAVKDEIGLQLLSDSLNSIYYPKLFKIVNEQKQEIAKYSAINWLIDYASGILFVQDSSQELVFPPDIEWEVEAYVYTGKYLDQKVQEAGQTGGVIGSPSDDLLIVDSDAVGDTDVIPGTVAIIFEDPIGSVPPPDYKAAIAYHEGELDFYTQDLNSNNIVMNLSGSVLSASSINAYGPAGSLQFHNSEGLFSGSEGLIWDEGSSFLTASNLFTNTITASNITASNIYSTDATITNLNSTNLRTDAITTDTINANTINIEGQGSTVPAAGIDKEVQYNSNGYLYATDKFIVSSSNEEGTLSTIIRDTVKNNSVSLFVNTGSLPENQTSGLLFENSSSAGIKELLVNRQYDNTTQIYKINSDLPLYINSDTQNKITAGTSKIDMSAGKVEIWPNDNKYLKLDANSISSNITDILVSSNTDDVNLYVFDLSAGPIWNERNDPTIRFKNASEEVEFLTNVRFFRLMSPMLFIKDIYGKQSWPAFEERLQPGSTDLTDINITAKKVSIQESLQLMDNYVNIKTNTILSSDKVFEQVYREEYGNYVTILETTLKPTIDGSGVAYFFETNLMVTEDIQIDSNSTVIDSMLQFDIEFFDAATNTSFEGNDSNIVDFVNVRMLSSDHSQNDDISDGMAKYLTGDGRNHGTYTGSFKFKNGIGYHELKMRIMARLYLLSINGNYDNSTIQYPSGTKTSIVVHRGSHLKVMPADTYSG